MNQAPFDMTSLEGFLSPRKCNTCKLTALGPPRTFSEEPETVFRYCSACGPETHTLPKLKKIRVYLDTNAVSNIFRSRQKQSKDFWIDINTLLEKAVADNIVCCPEAPCVRLEVSQDDRIGLGEYQKLTNSFKLYGEGWVYTAQGERAMKRFMAGKQPESQTLEDRDAFQRKVDVWEMPKRVRINVTGFENVLGNISRSAKADYLPLIDKVNTFKRREGVLSFQQALDSELQNCGQSLVRYYRESFRNRLSDSFYQTLNSLATGSMISNPMLPPHTKFEEFLLSEHFSSLPYVRLLGEMNAQLYMDSCGKAPRSPNSSDGFDVQFMSAYLPYMDWMLVEKYFGNMFQSNLRRTAAKWECNVVTTKADGLKEFTERMGAEIESRRIYGDVTRLLSEAEKRHGVDRWV